MAALIAGAMILGAISSCVMRIVPFFIALLAAIAIGFGSATLRGIGFGTILFPGLILLLTAQLAYGFGLLGQLALSRLGTSWDRFAVRRASSGAHQDRADRASNSIDPIRNRLV